MHLSMMMVFVFTSSLFGLVSATVSRSLLDRTGTASLDLSYAGVLTLLL